MSNLEAIAPIQEKIVSNSFHVLSVASLSLHSFRNYESARVEVTNAPVVITGRNGAGKTNILEALSLLTPGRGLRRAKIGEITRISSPIRGEARWGAPHESSLKTGPHPNLPPMGEGTAWAISASVHGMQGDAKIGTGRDPESDLQADKRIVKIDGKQARSQAELGRHLAMIWLTPQMEQLFHEGASAGRKFLDRLTYNFDTEHASRVNEYEFAMRERNRLLQDNRGDAVWFEALEQTMAETSVAIASARLHTVANINHAIAESPLSFPKAHMSVFGVAEDKLLAGASAVDVETELKHAWAKSRREDAASGRTQIGAHRSEMQVMHIEKHMPAASCSTGEQKALLLSIIFAQARAGANWRGVVPIILLDEVVAHLDPMRRRELFEEITHLGAQAWMTGTDAALFSDLEKRAVFLHVDDGKIVRKYP